MNDIPEYEDRDHRVVKIETYGERALAILTGHGDVKEKEHPYVEVKEPLYLKLYFTNMMTYEALLYGFLIILISLKQRFVLLTVKFNFKLF